MIDLGRGNSGVKVELYKFFRNNFFSFVTKREYFVTKVFKNRFKHHIIMMDVSIHFAQCFSFKKCRGNNLYTFLFRE